MWQCHNFQQCNTLCTSRFKDSKLLVASATHVDSTFWIHIINHLLRFMINLEKNQNKVLFTKASRANVGKSLWYLKLLYLINWAYERNSQKKNNDICVQDQLVSFSTNMSIFDRELSLTYSRIIFVVYKQLLLTSP